jgi:hypothetical protein
LILLGGFFLSSVNKTLASISTKFWFTELTLSASAFYSPSRIL